MKKFCEFVFLIIPFLFLSTSCMNVLNERPSQDVTFSINQEVCEQISRDLSNADSTSENVSITCLLFDKDMKQITSKTINTSLENLSTADIKLSKIPVGRNYKLELLISYNGNLIYSGKSTEPVDINSGGVIRAKIELSRAISTIAYGYLPASLRRSFCPSRLRYCSLSHRQRRGRNQLSVRICQGTGKPSYRQQEALQFLLFVAHSRIVPSFRF